MNAKELRVGNLIYNDFGEIQPVYGVDEKSILTKVEENGWSICFKPKTIQLTEEWLLKFGFFIIEINGKFEATLPNFRYNIYWNKYTDGFLFCDGETVLINFNYVHELQNLVFVLGQRELTVA